MGIGSPGRFDDRAPDSADTASSDVSRDGTGFVSPFERDVPLKSADQARTAAITMIPYLYCLAGVYAGLGSVQRGNIWHVPVVYAPSGSPWAFGDAPIVGEIQLHADTAELCRLSGRGEVEGCVRDLHRRSFADDRQDPQLSHLNLSVPVRTTEMAWRFVMRWLQCDHWPEDVVAGTPRAGQDCWIVSIFRTSVAGEKEWTADVKVDAAGGVIFAAPSRDAYIRAAATRAGLLQMLFDV